MKRFIFCLSMCCMVCLMGAQNMYALGWQKYFGTSANLETAHDICRVSSSETSGYVAVGMQRNLSTGTWAAYIVKMDYNGTAAWKTTYRGPNNNQDCIAYAVTNAFGGGFIVTGSISNNDNWDIFAVKYSTYGQIVWQWTSVGGSGYRCAYDIKQTSDNCYIMAGVSDDDKMAFLKIRSSGSYQWGKVINKTTDGSQVEQSIGYGVVQIGSDYHLCGQARLQSGDYQVMYVLLEVSGYIIHSKTFGTPYEDCGYDIIENTNLRWPIVAGRYGKSSTDSDYWVMQIDPNGNLSSDSKHWGYSNQEEELTSIAQDPYGSFVVAGRADMDGWGRYNVYLAKLMSNLVIRSQYYYGGSSNAGSLGVKTTGTQTSIGIATVAWPGQYGNGDVYVIRHD